MSQWAYRYKHAGIRHRSLPSPMCSVLQSSRGGGSRWTPSRFVSERASRVSQKNERVALDERKPLIPNFRALSLVQLKSVFVAAAGRLKRSFEYRGKTKAKIKCDSNKIIRYLFYLQCKFCR